ncbi:hemerythrin domain-containing protein [Sphingomonas sp.]|uniref:hemerythrin domain-containing protein n=1 Tax=Sphingomonas sp. TaxID=28214 RepID=UPI0025E5D4AE|nr:hemerythrin domain-containing protein [Sphingomonas sp.]
MVKIDILRAQHDDALAMADRLIELVDHYDPRSAAIPLLMQLNRLLGLLRVHFAHEDVELYPALTAARDPLVARTAQRFVEEMGGLAIELECFARRWSCSASIAGNIGEFRESAHQLMMTLAARIERENRILYPLVEAEAARQSRKAA